MTVRTICRSILFAFRGQFDLAGEQVRLLCIIVHDDLLAAVVHVQRMLGRPSFDPTQVTEILVVKLDRIGDMVNTTPIFDLLKQRYPDAPIDIVGHPGPLALLQQDPRIRERFIYRSALYHPVRVLPPGLGEWRLVYQLCRRRYSLVVYLRGSIPFLVLGARSRFAATKYVNSEPVVDRYVRALAGIVPVRETPRPRLHVPSSVSRSVEERLFSRVSRGRVRVAIHPTAAVSLKRWPPERYAAVADQLHDRFDADVHFFGSPAESTQLEAIARAAKATHAVHTTLGLQEVVAAIAACDLFVGNDSGLGHIAAATGVPMVMVWGSTNIREARPIVDRMQCTIIHRDLPCRAACPEIRCINPNQLQCLHEISTEDVFAAAARMLVSRGRVQTTRTLAWTSHDWSTRPRSVALRRI